MGTASTRCHARGYTVVELVVVLALLAVLATVAFPLAQTLKQRERERELTRALWSLRDALDAYQKASLQLPMGHPQRTSSGYPARLQDLVSGLPDAALPGGRRLFLRQLPRDPFAPIEWPAEQTWQLRSYASEADRPAPGEDVYDVRSSSTLVGLNGVPLAQW
jgi:general secretion pathway protein G